MKERIVSLLKVLLPSSLWTRRFTFWWLASLATLLTFDLLWMGQTTFRPMNHLPFWPYLFLASTLLALPAVFTRRSWPMVALLLLIDGVMVSNLMYCRTYFNAIPAQSYLLAGNLADFTDSVADQFRWYYLTLPLLTLGAAVAARRLLVGKGRRPAMTPYFVTVLALCVLAWLSDSWRGGPLKHMDGLSVNCYKSTCIAPIYTIAGYVIHDLTRSREELTPEKADEVYRWLAEHEKLASQQYADSLTCQREGRRNLVIILCESLESWPIEATVEGVELTPYLNSLIADSTTFYAPNVVTQAANGRSIDGQLLILAGMLPMRNTVYAYEAADNRFHTLPEAIKSHGGRSYILTCDKPHVWNQSRVARAFSVDTLIHDTSWDNNEPVGTARRLSDGGFMAQSVEKLRRGEIWPVGEQAFVMWVTYSGHNPFRLPEKLRRVEFKGDYPEIIKNYMTTANYTDHSLLTLIEYLKTRDDWAETMVVITGDHEGLAGDRKAAVRNKWAREFVDPGQHTPLIILNSPVGGRYDGQMGQVDIYSTLLDLMGLEGFKWRGMGQSVIDPSFPGVAVGFADDIQGDTAGVDAHLMEHLRQGRDVSDRILRFNMVKDY